MKNSRTTGYWVIIIVGILLLISLIMGQTMAFINYDFAVSIGMQESKDEVTEIGVAMNKGVGVSDTMFYIPLLIMGLIGMVKRKMWGVFAMFGALVITVYWPLFYVFFFYYANDIPGFNFTDFYSYVILLTIIALYGLWGIWYLYKNRKILGNED